MRYFLYSTSYFTKNKRIYLRNFNSTITMMTLLATFILTTTPANAINQRAYREKRSSRAWTSAAQLSSKFDKIRNISPKKLMEI
ncbi:unnamed protein product [Candida parapsilosis]